MTRGSGRTGLLLGIAVVGAVAWFGLRSPAEPEIPELTPEERLELDDRVAPLLAPCHHGKPFTVDTSDMPRVLADHLVFADLEPLRRAKAELAELGAPVIPELKRVLDDAYTNKWEHAVVENVLAVCALMEEPAGLELILEGLRHPSEAVRLTALDGMRKHGGPEHYDAIEAILPLSSTVEYIADVMTAMSAVDPERFSAHLTGLLETGEMRPVWKFVAPLVVDVESPEIRARLAAVAPSTDRNIRAFLFAAAAESDVVALTELRALLTSDVPVERELALRAVKEASLEREAHVVFEQDDVESLRATAAGIIAESELPERDEWLIAGLSDPGANVRAVCLRALVETGEPTGMARVFEMLREGVKERNDAIQALRYRWLLTDDSAGRAFDVLIELFYEYEEVDPARAVEIMQAIAQVRGRRSAEFLMQIGRDSTGEIRGWPIHRWCAFQVYNTGPEGLAYLRELHAAEEDPMRRMDYLSAIWQDHSDEARELLRGVVLDERSSPFEVLYAADRLARIGPAYEQAPFLKRAAYFESTHAKVRPALQCLLWRWFG